MQQNIIITNIIETMKMKRLFTFALALAAAATAVMAQMQMPPIPVDKDVRIGKLPNGITYYIRHNNWPENRADFYIAQKVGSIQEEESQRGLAHFLEHMCFNGTTHFPGDALLRYCESIGVKFGTDLNAYTSIEETVYNISNVPTARQSALDSCLLILHDWANDLTLDPTEIDKERGVIHEEWRGRRDAQSRMFERCLPKLYPGSKYGLRMPIGLMSVVDNFKYKELRDYYEKWYRPDNQGIIVVGNIDLDHTEAMIKKMFSDIEMPANPAKVEKEAVPDNDKPIVIIEKDKEQAYNLIEVMFKHPAIPDEAKANMDYLVLGFINSAATSMINARLGEYALKADCPFVQGYANDGKFIFASTVDALSAGALPKDGKLEETLSALIKELRRAAEFGFTATEFERFKANTLSSLDKMYSNKDKRSNTQFCNEYKEHFLANEPIPSIDDYYATMKQVVPMIPVDAVNGYMAELMPKSDSNMVILNFNNEKDGAVYPTEEGLLKAVAEAKAAKIEAYVDNVKNEPLITEMPKKGSIKKITDSKQFGYKELLLSNGVKVVLKNTDFQKDQVVLTAEGFGGSSLYGEKDFTNIKMFNEVIENSGLGNFSNTELRKALAGKIAGASMSLSTTRQYISGQSTPKDVETMMQLVHLYFTKINKDQTSFDTYMKASEISLRNKKLDPDNAFGDSLGVTMNCHNPRFASLQLENLKEVDYDRILQMAKELTANAAAYTFTIIGNYDEATLLPLIEQYIASLPAQKKVVMGHRVDTDAKGNVTNSFKRKMESPKAMSVMAWTSQGMKYTLDNCIKADITGQILSMIYLKKIREDASAAYSCGAQGSMGRQDDKIDCGVMAYCPMKPEKAELALSIMRDEIKAMATTCDAEMLKKVQEYMLKNHDSALKNNGYWMKVINSYRNYGIDLHTDFVKTVEAQTPATISAFVKELLSAGNHVEVVMLPEE